MTRTALYFPALIFILILSSASCTDDFPLSDTQTAVNLVRNPNGTQGPENNQGNGSSGTSSTGSDCTNGNAVNTSRAACTTTLSYSPQVQITVYGMTRIVTANNIPDHKVGQAGPNRVSPQNSTYRITTNPRVAGSVTSLLSSTGPAYSFGILLNGVEVDPVAAEPWPHNGSLATANWTWNLEAMHVRIGLDCNNAHVQPTGKYHYHGNPSLLIESMGVSSNSMTLIGFAADGFPIYYKYGYADASGVDSGIKSLKSSYKLKSGPRPGDGKSAPCGTYDGVYSNDFEYVAGLGDLDECNGRNGVTPEYPDGTYYYVITEDFPYIPRCFTGTPSGDFRIGF